MQKQHKKNNKRKTLATYFTVYLILNLKQGYSPLSRSYSDITENI